MHPATPITKAQMTKEYSFRLKTFIPELAAEISSSRIAASPNPSLERKAYHITKIDTIAIAKASQTPKQFQQAMLKDKTLP